MSGHFAVARSLALVVSVSLSLIATPAVSAGSKYKVLYDFYGYNGFPGPNGGLPRLFAALAIDGAGNLYGAAAGGTGTACFGPCGVVFEMTPGPKGKWTESVAFNFTDPTTQGSPDTALALDSQGNVYGGASGGKQGYLDLIYQLTPGTGGWNLNVIEDPGVSIGLIADAAGKNFYGFFGDWIRELSPGTDGWTLKTLYEFCRNGNCQTGDQPLVPLSWDAKGNLYGTTYSGGFNYPQCYCGVAFQLTPSSDGTWKYHRLHVFGSFPKDGRYPYGGLIADASGNVYGTAAQGGPNQVGTVFKLTQGKGGRWKETLLYGFPNACNCGGPGGNLVFDRAGNLYGTASTNDLCVGGGSGCGLVFKLTPQKSGTWKYSVVHLFRGPDGDFPNGLTMDKKGRLYGTTTLGGKYNVGVVFQITP